MCRWTSVDELEEMQVQLPRLGARFLAYMTVNGLANLL